MPASMVSLSQPFPQPLASRFLPGLRLGRGVLRDACGPSIAFGSRSLCLEEVVQGEGLMEEGQAEQQRCEGCRGGRRGAPAPSRPWAKEQMELHEVG